MHDEKQPVIVKPNWGISEEDSGLVWSKLQFQLQLQQQPQQQQQELLSTMQAASRQPQRSSMKMRGLHGPTAVWNQGPVVSTPSAGSGLHHLYRQEAAATAPYVLLDPWKQQQQQQQQQQRAAMETISLSLSSSSGSGSGSETFARERQFLLEDHRTTSTEPKSSSHYAGQQKQQPQDPSSASARLAARRDWEDDELLSLRPPNSSSSSSPEPYSQRNGTKRVRECPEETTPTKKADCSPPGLQLVTVLVECAEALNREDTATTMSLLEQLRQGASVSGDSMQRLAAHFSQALAMRVAATTKNPKLELARDRHGGGEEENEYLSAFTALYKVSPFFQIAHFTANQAILEATEGEETVHIIDLDLMQGFQWPSLMQAMASRPGGPPALLRLTGLGLRQESLRETGNRLSSFAANCSVPFEFQGIAIGNGSKGWLDRVELRDGEAVAVNSVFKLHRLLGGDSAALDRFLTAVSSRVRPRVVTLVEQEASHNAPGFMARFLEALHYYAAVFDSLDASLPQRNEERLRIEAVMFATQITNILACEGDQRVERHERMDFWSSKMVAAGFRQLPLSSHAVRQARLLLQMCPCDGYRLVESPITPSAPDVGSISLAWQDGCLLLTASAWACTAAPDSSSSNPCSPVSLSVSSSFDLLS